MNITVIRMNDIRQASLSNNTRTVSKSSKHLQQPQAPRYVTKVRCGIIWYPTTDDEIRNAATEQYEAMCAIRLPTLTNYVKKKPYDTGACVWFIGGGVDRMAGLG